jgi:hypothetical protein
MNTYVLYSIILAIVIVIIVLVKLLMVRPPRMFDSIDGYSNVLRDLHIKNGLSKLVSGDSLDNKIRGEVEILMTAGSTMSTSTDSSIDETVLVVSDYPLVSGTPVSGYIIDDLDKSLINKTSDYVCAMYVKRLSSPDNDGGSIYWGPSRDLDLTRLPDDEIDSNPYFLVINSKMLNTDQWYLMVGVLRHGDSSFMGVSSGTGIYNLIDSQKIEASRNLYDYKTDLDNTRNLGFRTFITTDVGGRDDQIATQVSWTRPFVFEVPDATDDIVDSIVSKMLVPKN